MSSSSGAEGTLITSPHEHQANAPVAKTMDAKLMVATGSGDVQQLKDLVNKQEQDSKMMVVVVAKQQAAASAEKPHSQQGNMDPHLLALASSGSSEELKSLLSREESQASGHGTGGSLTTRRASSYDDDTEANESILEGVTAEGDTALHVVAGCGQGHNLFTRRWRWYLTCAEHHALTTYGDGDNFLDSACIIYRKEKRLLFAQNNKGDTPLHCAARAGKSKMVACLIEIAEGEDRMEELLRKENKHKETALHEAVRVGNKDIVDLLMGKDSALANFPQDGGASPMYLAIMLKQNEIVKTLHDKSSHGMLSFSGPNGQNALHAAVLRHRDLTKLLEWNETHLCPQNKDLTTERDENGSTPLHFAAAIKFMTQFEPSRICWQVLDANPDALYQPDHAGFFPIHVAASVGAFRNVNMFVEKCPGSASLRDAKGRTFLHVAVEKKEVDVIKNACKHLSLSWIMNMVDNDGNTAVHLAIKAKSIHMFCPLLGNPQVNLNLPNNRGETPLDIAQYNLPERVSYNFQSSEEQIHLTLTDVGAVKGVHRQDHLLEDNKTLNTTFDEESKETQVLKESTAALCIGSVLIATMTFGATFAMPGGYIADDGHHQSNAGSPVLARKPAFQGFAASNTWAFVSSTVATTALMRSGDPLFNIWSRKTNLAIASYMVSISITCLAAAFAFAAYVVLAPVAEFIACAVSFLTCLLLLYNQLEFITARFLLLLKPLCRRKGLIRAYAVSVRAIMAAIVLHYWPLIPIFGWVALTKLYFKIEDMA